MAAKKDIPAIRVPTVSFYSHRGTINELEGTVPLSQRKKPEKGPFLMATDPEGLPLLADRVVATYARHVPIITITWAMEEGSRRSPDQFAAAGYPLDRAYNASLVYYQAPVSILVFPTQDSIIESQRLIAREIAERFRVTTERPSAMWLLLHSNPRAITPKPQQAPAANPSTALVFDRSGGFLNEDESGEAKLEFLHKKEPIGFTFQYGIRGPNERGEYVYHAAYWPMDESLLGNIPGLPGELFEDAYFLTFLVPPPPVPNRAVARGLAENMLRQAVPFIANAVKNWSGIPQGETPRFYTVEGRIVRRTEGK